MKRLLKNSLLLLFTAWCITACNQHTVYHSYQSIPYKGWEKSDTLFFQVPITDSLPTTLQLFAEVRNGSDYQHQNLYLIISNNLSDSLTIKTDTIEFVLTDKTGKWIGAGWGSLYQSVKPLGTALTTQPGTYTFKIVHGMKNELLPGINNIGIRIER